MAMSDISLSDIAAVTDGQRGGFGGFGNNGDGWWIILLFILLGGWGGNGRGWGNGGGNAGGDVLYPWINQSQQVNDGFRDQMIQTSVNGIQQGINGLGMQMCNGFNGVEMGANARQMANMQQAFSQQAAMSQGFNGVQAQLAECCCENRLATANQTATILAENCADRAAISDGIRDIIANQTASTQRILDKLCDQELFAERRENDNLRQQLNMANLQASQNAQNALIQQGFANEVDQLYNRLNTCPVPTTPVYGRTPIFTCNNNGCGCGN